MFPNKECTHGDQKTSLDLSALATDATSKLDILRHDCDTLSVDGTQVGILEETNKIGFRSLLKSQYRSRLEAKICFEVLGNLTNEALERLLLNWNERVRYDHVI